MMSLYLVLATTTSISQSLPTTRKQSLTRDVRVPAHLQSPYVQLSTSSPTNTPWGSRVRRSTAHIKQSLCDSVSDWNARTTAKDLWGHDVRIVQSIEVSKNNVTGESTRVNQYFYETYCASEALSCRGIDTSTYSSKCETKHIWAYARVINSNNEEGWVLIKLRGSCNCALYPLVSTQSQNIWEDLLKRR